MSDRGEPVVNSGRKSTTALLGFILFVSLMLVAAIERVLLKRLTDVYQNYSFFMSQMTTFLFCAVFFFVTLIQLIRNKIPKETREFSLWPFAAIAVFDCIAGILTMAAGKGVDGTVLALVLQGVIPFTLFFAVCILRKKFSWQHYAGSTIIFLGMVLTMVKSFVRKDDDANPGHRDDDEHLNWGLNVFYVVMLFVANVPGALSGITQEKVMGGAEVSVYYLQFWVAFFQFLLGWLIAPPAYWLQSPEGKFNLIFSDPVGAMKELWGDVKYDMWKNIWEGATCIGMQNHNPGDDCEKAWMVLVMYMVLSLIFNVLITLVCKYAGALSMQLALAAAVPVSVLFFLFEIPLLVPEAESWSWWVGAGLVVTIIGLCIYHLVPEAAAAPDLGEEGSTGTGEDGSMQRPLLQTSGEEP